MTTAKRNRTRRYYGKAYSSKCMRGSKSVDLTLDSAEATALVTALQKYSDEAFHSMQLGASFEEIRPMDLTIHDGKKTSEARFVVTVTRRL